MYFPLYFGDDLNHLDRIREYELLKIRKALGEEVDTILIEITEYFMNRATPNVFNPYDEACVLIEHDNQLENLFISMEENGIHQPNTLSTFEFYKRIQYFEKRAADLKK